MNKYQEAKKIILSSCVQSQTTYVNINIPYNYTQYIYQIDKKYIDTILELVDKTTPMEEEENNV